MAAGADWCAAIGIFGELPQKMRRIQHIIATDQNCTGLPVLPFIKFSAPFHMLYGNESALKIFQRKFAAQQSTPIVKMYCKAPLVDDFSLICESPLCNAAESTRYHIDIHFILPRQFQACPASPDMFARNRHPWPSLFSIPHSNQEFL